MIILNSQTAGSMDGRSADCMVQAVGGINRFKVSDFTLLQPRSWLEFISSMATMTDLWFRVLDQCYGINASGLYWAKLPLSWRIVIWVWHGRRPEISRALSAPGYFHSICLHWLSALATMIRRRGIPRRGSNSGNRGGRARPMPQTVDPISSMPPSPPMPELDKSRPNNSFQTSSFSFQSQLNRPTVTINFTVSVYEEEGNSSSSAPSDYAPSQDDSILLGDLDGCVYHVDHRQEDAPAPDQTQHPTPAQENDPVPEQMQYPILAQEDVLLCGPSHRYPRVLHLVTHPNGEPVMDEDGYVTWLASPSPEKEDAPPSPGHVG